MLTVAMVTSTTVAESSKGGLLMDFSPIHVESYAGFRADEAPRRFTWEGRLIEIEELLDRWHEVKDDPGRGRADYFRVRGADRRVYLLKHDLESDRWSVSG